MLKFVNFGSAPTFHINMFLPVFLGIYFQTLASYVLTVGNGGCIGSSCINSKGSEITLALPSSPAFKLRATATHVNLAFGHAICKARDNTPVEIATYTSSGSEIFEAVCTIAAVANSCFNPRGIKNALCLSAHYFALILSIGIAAMRSKIGIAPRSMQHA